VTAVAERDAKADAVQRRAARPRTSAWVTASAGTGKTTVLTNRVLSLLLDGTDPAKILCLTFTKAAAAEMANRLAQRLKDWAGGSDEEVVRDVSNLLGRPVDLAEIPAARELFARVLDAPGGMKIQTIHAFCQSLLGRFPLEAGVAPHFQVLDERTAAEMLDSARIEVLSSSLEAADSELARAAHEVAAHRHEQGFAEVMNELIGERGRLRRMIDRRAGLEAVVAEVFARLGADPRATPEALLRDGCRDEALDRMGLALVGEALAAGSDAERRKAETLAGWLAADVDARAAGFEGYRKLCLTDKGEPRKTLLTAAAQAAVPGALEVMAEEADRLVRLKAAVDAQKVARGTAAALRLGQAILAAYSRHKHARALLDYDDLIAHVRDLLAGPGAVAWVQYKLDGGIDHLLVDEAQDTNPDQWQVIRALSDEFFAGEGARERTRTVFAVGDPKQSIYSFQRASPASFGTMREHFARQAGQAAQDWADVRLEVSFRSVPAVLQAVDAVFAAPGAGAGVLEADETMHHEPVRAGEAGLVEVWPPADPEEVPEPAPWGPPTEAEPHLPASSRLAELIAKKIHHWTQDPAGAADPDSRLESKNRRLAAGDVMVLVRRRNAFVEDLVRALKRLGVPVSGVDRMVLSDQLAVMDLVALGRVLLLPEDDLSLATVLKGPLIGLGEEELFDLAHGREGTLWRALAQRAKAGGAYAAAYRELRELRALTDYRRPFELFAEVLGPRGGRRRLHARLGPDALDPIEEFLSLAILYERESIPSLEGFLHWLEMGAQEVKRDLEQGAGAVRVMTVHGAKGLQAPVVFLPDTLQTPRGSPELYWLGAESAGAAGAPEPSLALWPIRKDYDGDLAAAARAEHAAARDEEYRRLLYVAMTRAEDRLYVCGWNTLQTAPRDCWYNLIERGLGKIAEPADFDFTREIDGGWCGPGLRLTSPQTSAPPAAAAAAGQAEPARLPAWVDSPPASEPAAERAAMRPLAPSGPAEPEPAALSPLGGDRGQRFRRGLITHKLLEHLPDLPPDARASAGRRYLARPVWNLSEAEQRALLEETMAVMSAPQCAPLFAPGSLAEVALAGVVDGAEGPAAISGQVDRLAVAGERVLVVDYKTNRAPPADEAEVPALYLRQMAAYRALLAEIYPERRIECYLLWTDGARLMQLSPARLAAHAP
jgi:ATP-dependent helicase/nuclease subunit A